MADDLTCFDVIVAENGAVLEFPSSGRHVRLGHATLPDVIREFGQRHIEIAVGESVIPNV